VITRLYFDNIVRYIRAGGAVLVAAGPDYESPTSLWRTPLGTMLPAEPTGRTTDMPFRARLSELGKRHPVTRGLEGADQDPPHWSRWFRLVDARASKGTNLMEGPDGKPLLLLSREGEGRVALLLSDQIWLWARNYEGGGPYAPSCVAHVRLKLARRPGFRRVQQPRAVELSIEYDGEIVVMGSGQVLRVHHDLRRIALRSLDGGIG
jgi:hypothetical protein